MSLRVNLLRHTAITVYLFLSVCAFVYTMTRIELIPKPYFFTFYGMMAPYQGYITEDHELVAEGLTPAGWEAINLNPYLPFSRGEKHYRGNLLLFGLFGEEAKLQQYQKLARIIGNLEQERGRSYQAVQLHMEYWPVSPEGYEAMRKEPHVRREFIASTLSDKSQSAPFDTPMCHPECSESKRSEDEERIEGDTLATQDDTTEFVPQE